ncbi:MAG: Peptidase M48, Ste24p precursor, partial [uncultured Thermoleophilia bacterium]
EHDHRDPIPDPGSHLPAPRRPDRPLRLRRRPARRLVVRAPVRRDRGRLERRHVLEERQARPSHEPRPAARRGRRSGALRHGAPPGDARGRPDAAALRHPAGAAERLRHRPEPGARGDRRDGRHPPPHARLPARGRPRPRVRAHQEPRHPGPDGRRHDRRRDLGAGPVPAVLLPVRRLRRGGLGPARDDRRARGRDPRPDRRDADPDGRLPPAGVPRRRHRRAVPRVAAAARGRAGVARAGRPDAADARLAGGRAALHRQPAERAGPVGPLRDAPADPGARRPPARVGRL